MIPLIPPRELEAIAAANGRTVTEICRAAGVAVSTFTRWRAGKTQPTLDVYRRIYIAATIAQDAAA